MNDWLIALVIAVAAFFGGYKVADWRLTGEYTAEKLQNAKAAARALDIMTADRDRLAGELSAKDDQHTAELREAQNETNRLRDGLRNGSIGLRIAGKCPATSTPKSAPGTRVDTGTGAELAEPARQAYFALRDGIDQATAQLAACQDELKLRVGR